METRGRLDRARPSALLLELRTPESLGRSLQETRGIPHVTANLLQQGIRKEPPPISCFFGAGKTKLAQLARTISSSHAKMVFVRPMDGQT